MLALRHDPRSPCWPDTQRNYGHRRELAASTIYELGRLFLRPGGGRAHHMVDFCKREGPATGATGRNPH